MARISAARMGIAWGILWLTGSLFLPAGWAEETGAVEFEAAPRTLVRTGPPVWSLAVSPEGKWTAAGQDDGLILIRDTASKQTRQVLAGHSGVVSAVEFAPSGDYLASAGVDGKIRLWHAESGRMQFTLTGHHNWITCLAFSPDGRTLASGGYDKTVRVWNVKTGVQAELLTEHTGTVRSVAFSPDGQTLATAGDDGAIRFWNRKTGESETPLPQQTVGLCAVAFSPDGEKFLTVPQRGKIQVWDLKTHTAEQEFSAVSPSETDTSPQTARFTPDGLSVLVGTRGGRARLWLIETGQLLQALDGHEDVLTGLAITADGKTLYTAGLDGKIQAWPAQLPLERPLARLPIPAGQVWTLALSPAGKTLAVAGKGGFVELWDLNTGERQRSLEGFAGTVDCLEFSPDGHKIAAAGWRENQVVIWNVETGEVSRTITAPDKVRSIAISPDGKQLAAGYKSPSGPGIFSLEEDQAVRTLNGHELSVYDVAFSPDGTRIASCSGEWTQRTPGRVMIHDAADGARLAQFDDHSHAVRSLTFTPDGSRLCTLAQDGVLKIYDMQGLREMATLRNGLDSRPLACSADGRLLAAGLQNGNVTLWNIERREIERRLQGTDDLFALAFSPDGSLLFAADGNESVQIWKLSNGENSLARTIESWLPRTSSAPSSADDQPQETP